MKRRNIILIMMAAMMVVPAFSVAAKSSSKKKKAKTEAVATETKPAAPKKKASPYDKLMKDVQEKVEGETFSLYRTAKDKIYLSFPKSLSGRKILVGGTVTACSNPAYVNVGYKYNAPQYLQVDVQDSTVVLSVPGTNASTSDPSMQAAMERSFIPKVIRRVSIQAQSKDSSAVIFEVTGLINNAAPKGSNFAVTKSADEKTTWFGEMKAFKDNASVKVHSNVEFTKTLLMMKAKIGSGSMEYTVSFLLLPEKPMPARIQDARIGVFPVGPGEGSAKYDISSAEDGFRKYVLASRWRLELADTTAWLAGEQVAVKNPIVWYVDNSFPESWKEPIRKGVLAWNAAFEAIGLKDVMQVKDFPTPEEDPEFDPDNLKYSCLRYVPDATMNAMGPSWKDPVTGEILNASVIVYNDVIRLINNWRFVQTSQVDESVRAVKMPQEIIDESLVYVISHEIGHTLGLMHNMGASSAYETEKLRDPAFTAEYGTTPSIMDYARFNYVAQPGDKGVKLVPPALGVYDMYAIKWLYTPVVGAKDMWDEYAKAEKIIDEHAGDPLYRYGAQQMSGSLSYGAYDPSARTEDLGNDPIKSGNYGVSNLKYILPKINEWIAAGDSSFTQRKALYGQLVSQFNRYIGHTLAQVGGIYLNYAKEGDGVKPYAPVDKAKQKASLKWVIDQLSKSSWLNDASLVSNLPLSAPMSNNVCLVAARNLATTVPSNIMVATSAAGSQYTLKDYYDDLYKELFAPAGKLSTEVKTMQREILNTSAKEVKSSLSKGFADSSIAEEETLPEEVLNLLNDNEDWCGCQDECCGLGEGVGIGEGDRPYQAAISVTATDEALSYKIAFLGKVKTLAASRRNSAPAEDRAHYEFLYAKALNALEK